MSDSPSNQLIVGKLEDQLCNEVEDASTNLILMHTLLLKERLCRIDPHPDAFASECAKLIAKYHRILKRTGSLYVVCTVEDSIHLRQSCDSVFGRSNLRNEIVWRSFRLPSTNKAQRFLPTTLRILYYVSSQEAPFFEVRKAVDSARQLYNLVEPNTGRRYRLDSLLAPSAQSRVATEYEFLGVVRNWRYSHERMQQLFEQGRIMQANSLAIPRQKRYLDETQGQLLSDLWDDIPLSATPTGLPRELCNRIIRVSTSEGDTVLDPCCDAGELIIESQLSNRRWIGLSLDPMAIARVKHTFASYFGPGSVPLYSVQPNPANIIEAQHLASTSPQLFQSWVLSQLQAEPTSHADGIIHVYDKPESAQPSIFLVEVVAKELTSNTLSNALMQMSRMKAAGLIIVTAETPSRHLFEHAATAGNYLSPLGSSHPCVQMYSLEELLGGTRLDLPQAPRFAEVKSHTEKARAIDRHS